MNLPPDQPVLPRKWYEIWLDVWKHPRVETFRAILMEPGVSEKRAYIWVAVTGFISYLIYALITIPLIGDQDVFGPGMNYTVYALCLLVLSPMLGVLGIIISSAIYHWIAKMFGGQGTWKSLAYCFAAITAPVALISVPFSAFSSAMSLSQQASSLSPAMCLPLLILPLSIYALVLYVIAINAVEGIGTGKSILTYFIPVIVIVILSVCVSVVLVTTIYQAYS